MKNRILTSIIILLCIFLFSIHPLDLISRNHSKYSYQLIGEEKYKNVEIFKLNVVTGEWDNIIWTNRLLIVIPKDMRNNEKALLIIAGGFPSDRKIKQYIRISEIFKSVIVLVGDIPNQPIYGYREDELIAYSFERFLKEKNEQIPLLVPMVRSVMICMDVVQSFLEDKGLNIKYFVPSGASKRGWTTYLTAAFDPRVVALIPIVYDNLNIREQLKHQKEYYGDYSYKIAPYTRRNLPEKLETKEGKRLIEIVDPFNFIERLVQPKLIVLATNDEYWTVDSVNLYFDELIGPKYILYVPNNGHDIVDLDRVFETASAFFHLFSKNKFPNPKWEYENGVLKVWKVEGLKYATVWIAKSQNKDFRNSYWTSYPMISKKDRFEFNIESLPVDENMAFFADMRFEVEGYEFFLSTNMYSFFLKNTSK